MADNDPLIWQILLQFILIAINAIFACAEIAVISINDNKLERMAQAGDRRAQKLLSLTIQPAKFLATIQVGITLAGFLGSAFAADNFSGKIVAALTNVGVPIPASTLKAISVVVITIILSYFTLIFGELVPKRIAMQKSEELGLRMSGMIYVVAKVFAPIVFLLTTSTNGILRLFHIDPNDNDEHFTEEEIRMMVDVGSEKGTIDKEEKYIIDNVFEFDGKTAEEIMTHRMDLAMLWMEEDDETWEKTIEQSRFSHYPICDGTQDNIVGVLSAKDYFRLDEHDRETVMKGAVKPAQFVPESVRADLLFRNMKKLRNHFALVLDQYGGLSGVITVNDLLEELVGDLEDDSSAPEEEPLIERLDSGTWKVCGSAPLDEVAEAIGTRLPVDEYDTFASMTFGLLGTVPEDGQQPQIDAYGLTIQVREIREHRLETALVAKLQS